MPSMNNNNYLHEQELRVGLLILYSFFEGHREPKGDDIEAEHRYIVQRLLTLKLVPSADFTRNYDQQK